MIIHTVANGDTIYSISKQYSVPSSRIITDNYLDTTKKLFVGQSLIIGQPQKTCVVRGGDTLFSIAQRNGVSVLELLQNNPQVMLSPLTPSQPLNVKYNKSDTRDIIVSAYTGFASANEIERWMPYISVLHIQNGIEFKNGELAVQSNTKEIIRIARQYQAKPVITLECADEKGRFNKACFDTILSSPISIEKFVQNVLKTLEANSLSGIEIQFCGENDSKKYQMQEMLLALGGVLNEHGYMLIIPYFPNFASHKDAYELNDISDIIPVWNYIWDDKKSASPAAPLNEIINALKSSAISPFLSKSLLGIPTFGVEYSPSATGNKKQVVSASYGNSIAETYPIVAKTSAETQTPYICYNEKLRIGEPSKTLHFEDASSYFNKLDIVKTFDLAGVNVMSLDFSSPVFWQVLNQKFNIIKY